MNQKPSPDIFDDDLTNFRIDPTDPRLTPKANGQQRPKGRRRQFTIVPRVWELQLQSAKKVTTYRLALLLLHEHWRNGGNPVRITNALAMKFGIASRKAKLLALTELEGLNLVAVERSPRTAPLATPRLSSA
jgi:hypothetical protein